MDPNNGLCNWISASGACDYQRMYNFGGYPTMSNGYNTGYNGGSTIFGSGWSDTNYTYTSDANGVSSSYSNRPSAFVTGIYALGAIGAVLGAYAAGKQAEEMNTKQMEMAEKRLERQDRMQDLYMARQKKLDDRNDKFQRLLLLTQMKKLGIDDLA